MKKTLDLLHSKWREYLIEMIVIIVGILLAIALNNWNEDRKNKQNEIELLRGIRADFLSDLVTLDSVENRCMIRLSQFKKIDPGFGLLDGNPILKNDASTLAKYALLKNDTSTLIDYAFLMSRPPSYRPNRGTFNALQAGGNATRISNKALFIKIQNIYNGAVLGSLSVYETVKTREESLVWKRAFEKKYQPYKYIAELKDRQFIAELDYFYQGLKLYLTTLINIEEKMKQVVKDIESELSEG